jgi:hypothetical protein
MGAPCPAARVSNQYRERTSWRIVVLCAIQSYSIGEAATSGDALEGGGMKRLNGTDSVLRYGEAPNPHMHTVKVFVRRVQDDHRSLPLGVKKARHSKSPL